MDKILRPARFESDLNAPNVEKEWKHWLRTFQNYLGAQTITGNDEQQQTTKLQALTNSVSATVFEYIADATTYDAAIVILKGLYEKPKNLIYNRHKLATRAQSSEESIDQYMQQLEQLSKQCDFEAVSAEQNRKDYVRDSFINGLISSNIRQRLLENNTLTLADAYSKARTLEQAQKHSSLYSSSNVNISTETPPAVAAIGESSNEGTLAAAHRPLHGESIPSCSFCGGGLHQTRRQCPAASSNCNYCRKKGHWEQVCRLKHAQQTQPHNHQQHPPHQQQQQRFNSEGNRVSRRGGGVSAISSGPALMAVSGSEQPQSTTKKDVTRITTHVNNEPLDTLVDSGADYSYMNIDTAEVLNLFICDPSEERMNIKLADNSDSQVIGEAVVDVYVQGKKYTLVVSIMKNLFVDLILGKDFMALHKSVTFQFDKTSGNPPLILSDNSSSSVCAFSAMKVDPPLLFKHMSPDTKPISCKSKRYSKPDEDFIRETIQDWCQKGIIEPSNSPWRAQPLVTTETETHRKRVVIDYSRTVNRYT